METDLKKLIELNQEKQRALDNRIYYREQGERLVAKRHIELERKKYAEFKKLASRDKYFSIEKHITPLNLPHHILILTSEKNIGKTGEIYRLMRKAQSNNEKVVFLRSMAKEVDTSIRNMNMDAMVEDCPCPFFGVKEGAIYHFIDKDDYMQAYYAECAEKGIEPSFLKPEGKRVKQYGLPSGGFATSFRTCNTLGGGSFKGYKYIIMDEFISWQNQALMSKEVLANWVAFPSTIARSEKGLKLYFFGNLKEANSELLEYYGIRVTDQLRYVFRGGKKCKACKAICDLEWLPENEECPNCYGPGKILYINAGTTYRGVESQDESIRTAPAKDIETTLSNVPKTESDYVLSVPIFEKLDVLGYLAGSGAKGILLKCTHFLIEYRQGILEAGEGMYKGRKIKAIWIKPLESYYKFEKPIYSDNYETITRFRNVTKHASSIPTLESIMRAYKGRYLYFADKNTLDLFPILHHWLKISEEQLPFKKRT